MHTTCLTPIKNMVVSAIFLCTPFLSSAQATPLYSWAQTMGGAGADQANRMVTDASGNTYTTGTFSGTADFDPGAGTFNLTSAGGTDVFVCKRDAAGSLVWAVGLGGDSDDAGQYVALDASANVYITGSFKTISDFDPTAGTFNLTSVGGGDIFVCKLDVSGNLVWATGTGSTLDDAGNSLALDASGNVYTIGNMGNGTVDFDPGAGSFPLTSFGGTDVFIWQLDASGNFSNAWQMGGVTSDLGNAICIDGSGDVIAVGSFTATCDFDPGAGTFNLTSAGSNDVFACKLNTSSGLVWAKNMGGTSTDIGSTLVLDASGNLFIAGNYSGTADFNPDAGTYNLVSSGGSTDAYACKLDGATGSFGWAKSMGGAGFDRGIGINLYGTTKVLVTGSFSGTADFDPSLPVFNLTSAGSNDVYVCALDASGNFAWAFSVGGTGDDGAQSVQVAGSDIFIAGHYNATADFDPGTGTANLVSAGVADIFVAKYIPDCTPSDTTITATACDNYTLNDSVYTSSGTYTQTLTNSTGCDSTITLNLTINTVDASTTLAGGTLNANASGATYQWVDCNSGYSVISGETNQSFTPASSGNYAVVVSATGCTDTSSCTSVFPTALPDLQNKPTLAIYPNPTTGFVTLVSLSAGTVMIRDLSGKTVMTQTVGKGPNTISLNGLAAGIYQVTVSGIPGHSKLVKQ